MNAAFSSAHAFKAPLESEWDKMTDIWLESIKGAQSVFIF